MSFVFPGVIDAMLTGQIDVTASPEAHLVSKEPGRRMDSAESGDLVASVPVVLTVDNQAVKLDAVKFRDVSGPHVMGVLITADGRPLAYLDDGFPVTPIGTDVDVSIRDGVILRIG